MLERPKHPPPVSTPCAPLLFQKADHMLHDCILHIILCQLKFNDNDRHVYSYHQKHYLRVQPQILNELHFSDAELLDSTMAARLNGYCGGYGTLEEFERDIPSFNISLTSQEKVKELIAKGPGTDDD